MSGGDAFGAALLDWVRGGTIPETIERDDGYVEEGAGPEGYLAPLANWPAPERASLAYVQGRVLDAGCGAGRVALVLQDRGVEVVGIDESRLAVEAARAVGVDQVVRTSVGALDEGLARFGTVILFGNNFGIFGTPTRARTQLSAWARRAAPGTRLLVESTNGWSGGAPIIDRAYYRANLAHGRAPGQVRYRIRYAGIVGGWIDWLFVSQSELRSIARGTGWRVARVLGAGPLEPYVAVLEREGVRSSR